MSTAELDPAAVDHALRKLIADIDYDIHKYLECDEESGEDTYPEQVERFVKAYSEKTAVDPSAAEWARLDAANADEDTRARFTELLSTTTFECFDGHLFHLTDRDSMAIAHALTAAGARFDEVAS